MEGPYAAKLLAARIAVWFGVRPSIDAADKLILASFDPNPSKRGEQIVWRHGANWGTQDQEESRRHTAAPPAARRAGGRAARALEKELRAVEAI